MEETTARQSNASKGIAEAGPTNESISGKKFVFGVLWVFGGFIVVDGWWVILYNVAKNGTKNFASAGNLSFAVLVALLTVCSIYRFRKQLRKNGPVLAALLLLAVLLVGLPAFGIWSITPNSIRYPVLYGTMYHVPHSHVYVQKKPSDCEYDRSPLGDKGCHYEKQVSPISNDAARVTDVFVTWEKVQDEW